MNQHKAKTQSLLYKTKTILFGLIVIIGSFFYLEGCNENPSTESSLSPENFSFKVNPDSTILTIQRNGKTHTVDLNKLELFAASNLNELSSDHALKDLKDNAKSLRESLASFNQEPQGATASPKKYKFSGEIAPDGTIKPFDYGQKGIIFQFEDEKGKKWAYKMLMKLMAAGTKEVKEELELPAALQTVKNHKYNTGTWGVKGQNFSFIKEYVEGETLYKKIVDRTFSYETHGKPITKLHLALTTQNLRVGDLNPKNIMFTTEGLRVVDGQFIAKHDGNLFKTAKFNRKSLTSKLNVDPFVKWVKELFGHGRSTPDMPKVSEFEIQGLFTALKEQIDQVHTATNPCRWIRKGFPQ